MDANEVRSDEGLFGYMHLSAYVLHGCTNMSVHKRKKSSKKKSKKRSREHNDELPTGKSHKA